MAEVGSDPCWTLDESTPWTSHRLLPNFLHFHSTIQAAAACSQKKHRNSLRDSTPPMRLLIITGSGALTFMLHNLYVHKWPLSANGYQTTHFVAEYRREQNNIAILKLQNSSYLLEERQRRFISNAMHWFCTFCVDCCRQRHWGGKKINWINKD